MMFLTPQKLLRWVLHAIKEINGFNPLIDNKTIFEDFVEKKKKKAYEKLAEMSRNYGFAMGNLSDILHC